MARFRKLPPYAGTLLGILIVFTGRASLADHYYIPSGSMLPTVEIGDRVLVDKTAFGLRIPLTSHYLIEGSEPARGDVVVLASPDDGIVLLKRMVGLPGDRIAVSGGRVVLEGRVLPIQGEAGALIEQLGNHAHPIRLDSGGGRDLSPIEIPPGHYLVLGDNRGDSRDGRYFGLVPRGALIGRAFRLYRHGGEWAWRAL